MDYKTAWYIYTEIISTSLQELSNKLIQTGIRYSRLRVDWSLLSIEEKGQFDQERTIAHNAFISSCDILARNMAQRDENFSWRAMIGNDRKEIGDFACWIHLIIGIKAR
jgi:hypothetical protein